VRRGGSLLKELLDGGTHEVPYTRTRETVARTQVVIGAHGGPIEAVVRADEAPPWFRQTVNGRGWECPDSIGLGPTLAQYD
jgi:hypothetical protein